MRKTLIQISGLMILSGGMMAAAGVLAAEPPPAPAPAKARVYHVDSAEPSPLYVQVITRWAKETNFPKTIADVIVGKLQQDMKSDPRLEKIDTPALIADLEQYFYELFVSQETMRELAQLYSQVFTVDEMAELLKFYQTPLGQKLIKNDAELRLKSQALGMKMLEKHKRDYLEIIAKYIPKNGVTPQAAEQPSTLKVEVPAKTAPVKVKVPAK